MTQNQGYSYRHVLGPKSAGHSTLSYLTNYFPHSTEAEWERRLEAGEIVVANKSADGGEPLKAGSVMTWNRPGWIELDVPMDFSVIHEDAHLIAVDKPSGLPTLPGAGFYKNTLLSLVKENFAPARPLHRLGRATSGIVLFALNAESAAILTHQWPNIQKQYQALSTAVSDCCSYDIRSPIGELDHPRLGKVYAATAAGKRARSVARTLERREESTVFEVDLHTGRPHQIRIHLAFIGHPLVGDPLYATGGIPRGDQPGLPGEGGYWLHAKRIAFDHPESGNRVDLTAPLPKTLRCD